MTPSVGNAQPDLTLSPTELWAVHHVLLEHITTTQPGLRSHRFVPDELRDAFERIEEGECQFTATELRTMHMALREYLRCSSQTTHDVVAVGQAIDKIADALA